MARTRHHQVADLRHRPAVVAHHAGHTRAWTDPSRASPSTPITGRAIRMAALPDASRRLPRQARGRDRHRRHRRADHHRGGQGAGELYVFQRTPNWCTPLRNSPHRADERMQEIKAALQGSSLDCRESTLTASSIQLPIRASRRWTWTPRRSARPSSRSSTTRRASASGSGNFRDVHDGQARPTTR
jgi:hypothetical protein